MTLTDESYFSVTAIQALTPCRGHTLTKLRINAIENRVLQRKTIIKLNINKLITLSIFNYTISKT